MARTHLLHSILVVALTLLPAFVDAATRYVTDIGADGPACGSSAATACRSISRAIALAAVGDIILVGAGRYGDLNDNGVLGETGEETGAPGCSCVLAINKNVILMSSNGAAVTVIDGRSVAVRTNVLLITNGGEFGRPGKGFTVTPPKAANGYGIALDSANVLVRGNMVLGDWTGNDTIVGIITVNDAPVRIEGNHVTNWYAGISSRGAAIVSKNHVVANVLGIASSGGIVTGNVSTDNVAGFYLTATAKATGNASYMNNSGFIVDRTGTPFTGVVTKNNMFGEICGIANYGPGALDLANNYWGDPTGPGGPPASNVCTLSGGGPIITGPFATKPFAVKILKP